MHAIGIISCGFLWHTLVSIEKMQTRNQARAVARLPVRQHCKLIINEQTFERGSLTGWLERGLRFMLNMPQARGVLGAPELHLRHQAEDKEVK